MRKRLFIEELSALDIEEVFIACEEVEFKHKGNELRFITDGIFIYGVTTVDGDEVDVFSTYDFYNMILAFYGDEITTFIHDMKEIEEVIGHELLLSDSLSNNDMSIRQLEITHISLTKRRESKQ